MRKIKKVISALLTVAMVFTISSCSSSDNKWSYKDGNNELAIGVYIYNLVEAYSSASNLVEDKSKSVFEQQIEGISAEEWILKDAEERCKKMLVIDDLMKKNNLTLTDEEISSVNSTLNYYWTYFKTSYEDLGVSKNSYSEGAFLYTTKYNKVFYDKYNEDVVSADEIKEYFLKNYTDYSYFSIDLTTKDSDGNSIDLSDSEIEKIKGLMEKYVKMINNEGKTLDDVSHQYSIDHTPDSENTTDDTTTSNTSSNVSSDITNSDTSSNVSSDITNSDTSSNASSDITNSDTSSNASSDITSSDTSSNASSDITSSDTSSNTSGDDKKEEDKYAPDIKNDVTIMSNSSLGDELKGAIEGLDEGKATYIKVGTSYYFLYKGKIADSTELLEGDTGRHTVLNAMKGEEFSKEIEELAKNYKCEFNESALNKYGIDHIRKILGI